MSEQAVAEKSKEKKRFPVVAVALLLVAAVAAAAGGTWWYFVGRVPPEERIEPNAVVGSMPGKTLEQIQAELDRQVAESEVAFAINSSPRFESGSAKGNILFENPESNGKLTRVEITDDESGDLLYKSGLLEPGSYVPEAKLLVDLEAGSYTCTATIYAYKLEDETYIGKVAAGVTLVVES